MHPGTRRASARRKNASALRLVGQLLARFRREAGYTQESLCDRICAEYGTIASIEQGRRPLKPDLAAELDELLVTKGALSVAVENLPEMDKYPVWAAEFIDREREAVAINSYQALVVPGLLQTRAYATGVFRGDVPALGANEVEERVVARLDRQEIFSRSSPPMLSFVLCEAMLKDRIGGREVYREQLDSLLRASQLPGVAVQILGFGQAVHMGLDGPFVLLETPEHEHLAYMETQRGSVLVSEAGEVSVLAQKYAMLRTQAHTVEESRALLERYVGEA